MPDSIDGASVDEIYGALDGLIDAGVELLDELAEAGYIAPEWWMFVDTRTFELQSACSCVLAQLPAATDPVLLEGTEHAISPAYDTAYTREIKALSKVVLDLDQAPLHMVSSRTGIDGMDFGFDAPVCTIDGEFMNGGEVWAHMQEYWESILYHRRGESMIERLRHPSAVSLLR